VTESEVLSLGSFKVDPRSEGAIKAVEVDVGGFLGIGEKPVAVGFEALRFRRDEDGLSS
jgi:hypothetical protein